jgi:manganese efflux pump family protein
MFSLETSLLGIALAIDAAVVSFTLGLLGPHFGKGAVVAMVFGLFQFLMLWLGSLGGYLFSFSGYGYLFQLVVASIFLVIAIKVLQESLEAKKREIMWGPFQLVLLALATSIDALAAGVSFGTLPMPHIAAIEVGIITFVICGTAYALAGRVKNIQDKWLLRFAALIFFFLGGEILIKHFF